MQSNRKSRPFRLLRAIAICALLPICAASALAGQLGVQVAVTVQLITSSGQCSSAASGASVTVSCSNGSTVPLAGSIAVLASTAGNGAVLGPNGSFALDGRFLAPGQGPAELYGQGGPYISGWREVQLDNGRYVELTVSW